MGATAGHCLAIYCGTRNLLESNAVEPGLFGLEKAPKYNHDNYKC